MENSTSSTFITNTIYNVSIKCSICKTSNGFLTIKNSSALINNLTILNYQICNDFWFANLTQAKLNFSNGAFL